MGKPLKPGQLYAGRPPGTRPLNVSIDVAAWAVLVQYAPTGKSYGHFLSRLCFEHAARQEERERLLALLATPASP